MCVHMANRSRPLLGTHGAIRARVRIHILLLLVLLLLLLRLLLLRLLLILLLLLLLFLLLLQHPLRQITVQYITTTIPTLSPMMRMTHGKPCAHNRLQAQGSPCVIRIVGDWNGNSIFTVL